jgi:tRNA(Ile)-lysidine synthase
MILDDDPYLALTWFLDTFHLQPTQLGIVAVSGGADSIALLHALHRILPDSLIVGHINHHLRGDESDQDEAFVKSAAESLSLPFYSHQGIPPTIGIEENARKIRYDWLGQLADQQGCAWLATAHHADDQAETILHRLIRGTGIDGLVGIHRQDERWPGVQLIRPLLSHSREEIDQWLDSHGLQYRIDSSNLDLQFTRNRIRHEVIPILKELNPNAMTAIGRLSDQAVEVKNWFVEEAILHFQKAFLVSEEGIHLDLFHLRSISAMILRELFRYIWRCQDWPMGEMTAWHWNRLVGVVTGEERVIELPGKIRVRRRQKRIEITRKMDPSTES